MARKNTVKPVAEEPAVTEEIVKPVTEEQESTEKSAQATEEPMAVEEAAAASKEKPERKKRTRKTAAEKAKEVAAKLKAKEKEKAANMKPEIMIQFQGSEVNVDSLIESAKAEFHQQKKRKRITSLKLYVKPEERAAYYVINEDHEGKVEY